MSESENRILEVENLKKHFPIKRGIIKRTVGHVRAVDGVTFWIREGETVGLVGESGCGKTTTGRCIIRLIEPTDGTVRFRQDGEMKDLSLLDDGQMRLVRREMQIIFQDPYSSLDSRMTVRDIIAEPMRVQGLGTRSSRTERVRSLMERVGLRGYQMNRYPHAFSGGQRQRIGVARALMLEPRLIICDEPVSALDVSIQAQIINLLMDLQEDFGLSFLFIAHDLSVVEHISDRVLVMYLGKIVESATSEEIFQHPLHPYTEALLAAVPLGDPELQTKRKPLGGDVPNPAKPPSGCNFHTRCPYAEDVCSQEEPALVESESRSGHYAACHFAEELSLSPYTELWAGAGDA